MANKIQILLSILIVTILVTLIHGQTPAPKGKTASATVVKPKTKTSAKKGSTGKKSGSVTNGNSTGTRAPIQFPPFEDEGRFCRPNAPWSRPFYRSKLDGAVCCRDQIVQAATITPEVTGECAISTKTDGNGLLDSAPLWCSYTCSLKKLGVIDSNGMTKPDEFFNHLTFTLGNKTKGNLRLIMSNHLNCMKPFKHAKLPCYTPMGFHKCYVDALEYMCNNGMPEGNDFSKIPPSKNDYTNLEPTCETGGKQVMPSCCHGKPLPWTIADLIEAPRNSTAMKTCLTNMRHPICLATCFLNSAGVVDDSMDVNVDAFNEKILGLFPTVQPSVWMNFLGPTYVFFDETLDEMSANIPNEFRMCLFQDKMLNFHEDKIAQYCEMTPEEVKEIKNDQLAV